MADTLNLIALEIGPQDAETTQGAGRQGSGRAAQGRSPRRARRSPTSTARPTSSASWSTDSKGRSGGFSETGLTELSLAIRELRQLTANLNVIATKLERDPAGFVFSGKQGYTPK